MSLSITTLAKISPPRSVKKIEAHERRALSYKVSVTDRLGLKKLTREMVEKWGGIDILVNNAAINRGDNFATTTDRAWDEVIDTNVGSLFAVTKPIYKQMIRQRKGSILNITSIGAMRALPTAVHYATSKAAMIGFTKCLSREAGTFGVKVNAIAAGIFDTELAAATARDDCCKCITSGRRRAARVGRKSWLSTQPSWSAIAIVS